MKLSKYIIGVDEAGRGALAGPLVVAAAAFLREAPVVTATWRGVRSDKTLTVNDSKTFANPDHRSVLAQAVREQSALVCVLERTAKEIDARLMFTVFPETIKLVISRTVERLRAQDPSADEAGDYLVMLDGEFDVPANMPCPVQAIVRGDKQIWQIGAASVLAKVFRDERMLALHERYPDYGFDQHKGYPVPAHKKLLKQHGPSAVHRRTFKPVAEVNGLPEGFEA